MEDGVRPKAVSADAFPGRCVSIDLEVEPKTNRLQSFAAVRPDVGEAFAYSRGDLGQALAGLDAYADDADFVLGHNIIHFDMRHLEAARRDLRLLEKPTIDTLWLNPLAFPRNPYHHLVKHYQDGRLQAGQPCIEVFGSLEAESVAVGRWLAECIDGGVPVDAVKVLVRSDAELPRAHDAIRASGKPGVEAALMHDAKGREYRAVVVMACDADILPSEKRLLSASDERALAEIFDTERHLLYVAATRARERLWICAATPPSEFIEDLMG